ncbi:MAG: DUF2007 domain-containing protein [Bacteroidia bacterium]|nr:DUF2007 domain-containing protein [Bacteroidia bacterium]
MEINKDSVIEIFSGTLWESEMVTSLLSNAEIESFQKNTLLNSNLYDPIYSSGVKVMILSSDFKMAKEIIDDYYRNMNNNLPPED